MKSLANDMTTQLAPRVLRRSPALILVAVVLLAAACEPQPADRPPAVAPPEIPFDPEGVLVFFNGATSIDSIQIEIAETDSARTRGLMQRSGLPPNSGMLFLFDREEPQSFWMANTPLSLDIFFVDSDSQIVSIKKYTRPLSPESVVSDAPAQYVIETTAGYADSRGIVEGHRVRWQRLSPRSADTTASD